MTQFFRHFPSLFPFRTKSASKNDLEKALSETTRLDSHSVVTSGSFGRGEKLFGWFLSSAPRIVVISIEPSVNDSRSPTFKKQPGQNTIGKTDRTRSKGRLENEVVKKVVDLKNVLSVSFHEEFNAMSVIYQHDSSFDADILLIPNISGFDQFSDVQHYFLLTRRQSQLLPANANPVGVKWSGTQVVNRKLVVWVVSDKHVVLAQQNDDTIRVPLFHVFDISFKVPDAENEKGTLQVSYVYSEKIGSYREQDASALLSMPHCYTIQKASVQLENFGSESDFEEASLLWRQQVQLRMMQDILEGKSVSHEDGLAQKCRELLKEKTLSQTQPNQGWRSSFFLPNDQSESSSSSRPAESMWHIVGTMEQPIDVSLIQRKLSKKRQLLKTLDDDIITATEREDLEIETVNESLEELLDFSYLSLDRSNSRRQESSLARSKQSPKKPIPSLSPSLSLSPSSSPTLRTLSPLEKLKHRIKRLSGQVLYRATFEYDATGPGELSFKESDKLRVIKKDPSGWWYCCLECGDNDCLFEERSETEGWVPSNFLSLVDE